LIVLISNAHCRFCAFIGAEAEMVRHRKIENQLA